MNSYIDMQIRNMKMYLQTFEQSCELAATKDDGQIDPTEREQLNKIKSAVKRFCQELDKIK